MILNALKTPDIQEEGRHGAVAATLIFLLFLYPLLRAPVPCAAQSEITANFPRNNWQPTRAPLGARYESDKVCAQCHSEIAQRQEQTGMAHALELTAECLILHQHPNLTVRIGPYTYHIVTRGGSSIYSVSDGTQVFSAPVLYAFGQGQAGQTYVYHYNGAYYESRVSFFNDTKTLDLTLGYSRTHPRNVEEAAGRRTSTDESRDCFACHSTAAVQNENLQLEHLMPGITCEGCHGPGAEHVEAVRSRNLKSLHIFNPGRLSTQDLADFCGSCHRSWQQVEMMHATGVQTVRFQPYRLELSRCFDAADPRISCLACHDPHHEVRTDAAFYDSKCLACHRGGGKSFKRSASIQSVISQRRSLAVAAASARRSLLLKSGGQRPPLQNQAPPTYGVTYRTAPACPVSQKNCVTCHMPKYELPGAHFKFTDHYIRIARAGAPYPN